MVHKKVFKDGDSWCVLVGEDLQTGFALFADTKQEAIDKFRSRMVTVYKPRWLVEETVFDGDELIKMDENLVEIPSCQSKVDISNIYETHLGGEFRSKKESIRFIINQLELDEEVE